MQLVTAHSGTVPADIVQSSPRRDIRLNTVVFSNSGALGETTTAFAEKKSQCYDYWGLDRNI